MTNEMRNAIYEIIDAIEEPITEEVIENNICRNCPFAGRCLREELYYGCPAWEEAMGEDL